MISFPCGHCNRQLKVKDEHAGKRAKCPGCGRLVAAPALAVPTPISNVGSPEVVDKKGAPSRASLGGEESTPPHKKPTEAGKESLSGVGGETAPGDRFNPDGEPNADSWDFLAPAQSPDEMGRLGPYRVLNVLGAGGMGVVFRAQDPHLERPVALKAMLPSAARIPNAKERFYREAKAAAALKHPHVVTVFQVGEDRGAPYLAMELLEGESLGDRLKRESGAPVAEILRVGRETAKGLAAAHEKGLIHRDVKPANIWLEGKEAHVKILDFGLARAARGQAQLTQSGAILGTPAYMAPEQAAGKQVDGRCDLFSLGCVLYHMCTGETPFKGGDTLSILMALALENPPPPASLNPAIPAGLSELVMRLLAKKPEDRPRSAETVVAALQEIEGRIAGATAPPRPQAGKGKGRTELEATLTYAGRPAKRRPRRARLLGGVVVIGLGAAGLLLIGLLRSGEKQAAPDRPGRDSPAAQLPKPPALPEKVGEADAATPTEDTPLPTQNIDLLGLLDLQKDCVSVPNLTGANKWTRTGGKLTYTSDGKAGKIVAPVSLKNARQFEIAAEVRRLSGDSVFTFDFASSDQLGTGLDVYIGGRIELKLENGRREKIGEWPATIHDGGLIVTRVCHETNGQRGSVVVTVDGVEAAKWIGDVSKIGTPLEGYSDFPGQPTIGIFCFKDSYEFDSWQLTIYDGQAQRLRRP